MRRVRGLGSGREVPAVGGVGAEAEAVKVSGFAEYEELSFDELEVRLRALLGKAVMAQVSVGDALTAEGYGIATFLDRTNDHGLDDPTGATLTLGVPGMWNVSVDERLMNEAAVLRPGLSEDFYLAVTLAFGTTVSIGLDDDYGARLTAARRWQHGA